MKRAIAVIAVSITVAAASVLSASAQSFVTGTAGNAHFKFAVPAVWNGDVVIWNHGYSLDAITPFAIDPANPLAGLGPLAALQFFEGYALAASTYRQVGWAVFKSNNDLQSMMDAFASQFGPPNRIYVTGASLGGLVTIKAIEEANLGNVVGGLSLCGAVAGSRNWDGALDLRLIYDAVCSAVPGAAIPGGAHGLPEDSSITPNQVALAVHQCTGILAPPAGRSPEQQARLTRILALTFLPENFLLIDMGFATFGLRDLVDDQGKLHGKIGTGNITVDYGDTLINGSIARVAPDSGAQNRLENNYTPTGIVGSTRIVSLHTDKDGLVFVETESDYASRVPAANFTAAVAVEAVPTHCGFTSAEVVAGWESLLGWVAGAPQPTAASIQGTCQLVAPVFGGPCRINPAFVVPDIDSRIRPR
ncbi:MAG: hypothetical protein ACRD1S_11140 [Vicinamibacterales bacterium]